MRQMGGAHGEGGISSRPDGRLQVRVTMPSGKRVIRMVPAMKDRRAQRRLAERIRRQLVEARLADLDPAGQTLEAYLRSWLRGLADARHARVRPRTLEFYTMIVERHILPRRIAGIRLDRLGERHVQAWLDDEPGGVRSIHHYRAVLRRALNVAVRQRILSRNPAIAVELPEAPEFAGDPLSIEEARQLLSTSASSRLAALWRLALVTGLRQGELLGLAWDDVELGGNDGRADGGDRESLAGDHGRHQRRRVADVRVRLGRVGSEDQDGLGRAHRGSANPSITIRAQLARHAGEWVRTPTKAARGLQTIAIDAETARALAEHKRRQAAERRPDWKYWGLVFTTPRGQPIGRSEALRAFHAACDVAGIRRRRFHDMRGSSATILADLGVPEDVRMSRLGHATTSMARHYAGASATQDREAVERLARAIG